MSVCRSCGATILWVVTPAGKRMPVDVDPHPDGNVFVTGWAGQVLSADDVALARSEDKPLHLSHFATCAQAAQHRRR